MEASPLKKLPAELRNRIYDLALYTPKGIELTENDDSDGKKLHAKAQTTIALTVTCREVRKDTLSMFYAINQFSIATDYFQILQDKVDLEEREGNPFPDVAAWLGMIGKENANHLTHLCFKLGTCEGKSTCAENLPDLWHTLRQHIDAIGLSLPMTAVYVDFHMPHSMFTYRSLHLSKIPLNNEVQARHRLSEAVEVEAALLQAHGNWSTGQGDPYTQPEWDSLFSIFINSATSSNSRYAGCSSTGDAARRDLDRWHKLLCAMVLGGDA